MSTLIQYQTINLLFEACKEDTFIFLTSAWSKLKPCIKLFVKSTEITLFQDFADLLHDHISADKKLR